MAESLRERYPFLLSSADGSHVVVPLKRHRVSAIVEELNEMLSPLSADVDALRESLAAVEAGERTLRDGKARAALPHFERAAGLLTDDSSRIRAGASAAREAITASQQLADRVRALVTEARAAEGRGNWRAVVELCAQAFAIEPGRADLLALSAKARAAVDAEKQARVRQAQKLLAQAEKAIQHAHFDDADRILGEAQKLEVEDEAVKLARARLNDARLAASVADARTRRAARELAEARAMFDAGDRQGAIDKLRAVTAEDVAAPGIVVELRAMSAEMDRLAVDERRRAQAAAHAREAAAHWEAGEIDKALKSADLALSLDLGETGALRVQSLARTRLREQAEAAARSTQAEARVAKARALLASGRFEKAAREAQDALDLEPGRADAALVVSEARRLEADAFAVRARQEAAAAREREAEQIVKAARRDLRAGAYDRAAWAAENALLIRPDHEQAREILVQARALLAANDQRRVDPDDTVQLAGGTPLPIDPAATVVMAPDAVKHPEAGSGGWASRIRQKLQRSRGSTPTSPRGGPTSTT